MTDDLCYATASELASLYRRRAASPVEVVTAILSRIEAVNPLTNAFITVVADAALEGARAAERQLAVDGDQPSLLGVPYSLKDLYATAGVRTTAGSKPLAEWVPTIDSTVHARLRAVGGILLGKTNMSEYAMEPLNANPWYGSTRNPWRLDRITGGSSGGSAAAVAAGLGPISLGSDTGGSIRIPAALCGVVGLKPTLGRVSVYGVVPLAWSLDHVGPLTRTVRDAALVLQTIAGHDHRDASSARVPVDDYASALDGGVRGMRVGIPRQFFFDRLEPTVERTVRSAIDVLGSLGVDLREVSIPWAEEALAVSQVISYIEPADYHRAAFETRPSDLGPRVQDRVLVATLLRGTDYVRAQRVRSQLYDRCCDLFTQVEALVMPTVAVGAPVGAVDAPVASPGTATGSVLPRLTRLHNATGLPAITVPCGFDGDGMPVGLQITARHFAEPVILRLANAYESATDWISHHPCLAV